MMGWCIVQILQASLDHSSIHKFLIKSFSFMFVLALALKQITFKAEISSSKYTADKFCVKNEDVTNPVVQV